MLNNAYLINPKFPFMKTYSSTLNLLYGSYSTLSSYTKHFYWLTLTIYMGLSISQPVCAQEIGVAGTLIGNSIGLNQNVAVVLCEYLNDETSFLDSLGNEIDSDTWAEIMDDKVNPYFMEATKQPASGQGITSFNFIPIPGKCQLSYPDTMPEDDPQILMREAMDAIVYADEATPGIFNTTKRIIFAVNAPKRARATWVYFPMMLPNSGLKMLAVAAVGLEEVAEKDYSTIAHEMGHELGLPDLYQLDGVNGRLIGRWGQMGFDALQHFTAYSRYMANWIEDPDTRVRTVTSLVPPVGTLTVDVPNNTNDHPELIRFDASPDVAGLTGSAMAGAPPFIGYYVEARDTLQGLDTVLANFGYDPGVIIYRHTDWLNTETGFAARPLAVQHPTETSPISNPSTAAFQVGETFNDPALGLSITVYSRNEDGSYNLLVNWNPPPRPDIIFTDLLLDSPVNGMGTTQYPTLFGDPVMDFVGVRVVPPSVTITRPAHTITLSVTNAGTGASPAGLTGSLVLMGPTVFAGFNPLDISTYLASSIGTFPFTLPPLSPGQSTTLTFTFTPQNSFIALAYLEPNNAETDIANLNNVYTEPFLDVPLLTYASPYPDLEYEMEVGNLDEKAHMIAFSMDMPSTAPDFWNVKKLKNPSVFLHKGQNAKFEVAFEPPSPEQVKPRGQIGRVALTAWMDEGDSFVPIMNIPRYYRLTKTAGITLSCEGGGGKYSLGGTLSQMIDNKAVYPLGNRDIRLVVSGKKSGEEAITLKTNNNGQFAHSFQIEDPDDTYAAIANFVGSQDFTEAVSAICEMKGDETPPTKPDKPTSSTAALKFVKIVQMKKSFYLYIELTAPADRSGIILLPQSSEEKLMKTGKVFIPAGKSSMQVPISVSKAYKGQSITFKVQYNRSIKTATIGKTFSADRLPIKRKP